MSGPVAKVLATRGGGDLGGRDKRPDIADVYRDYAPFVWRVARGLGVPAPLVEDVVHDVFLVVHRRLGEFEGRGTLQSWLFGITRRVALHHHRSVHRESRRLELVTAEPQVTSDLDDHVARIEAGQAVEQFLDTLSENLRLVFFLCDVEGLPATEVSSALGIGINTVYSRLRRARRRFDTFVQDTELREEGSGA